MKRLIFILILALSSLLAFVGLCAITAPLLPGIVFTSLAGLEGLTSVGSLTLIQNLALQNIDALTGLTSLEADLQIVGNRSLTSLQGLSGIEVVPGNLTISNNDQLVSLAADGDTAAQWGLANRAIASDEVDAEALVAARLLATRPRQSLTATKRLMRDHTAISEQIGQEMSEFAARLASPEAREAFQAFAERRAPDFANV